MAKPELIRLVEQFEEVSKNTVVSITLSHEFGSQTISMSIQKFKELLKL